MAYLGNALGSKHHFLILRQLPGAVGDRKPEEPALRTLLSYYPSWMCTVIGARMLHRKWREIKQHLIRLPDLALLGCCLVSLHILCDILQTITVLNRAGGDVCLLHNSQ